MKKIKIFHLLIAMLTAISFTACGGGGGGGDGGDSGSPAPSGGGGSTTGVWDNPSSTWDNATWGP